MIFYHRYADNCEHLGCAPSVVVYIPPGARADAYSTLCLWIVPGTQEVE